MSHPPRRAAEAEARAALGARGRRIDVVKARERAAHACAVETSELGEGTEHTWGWSFTPARPEPGAGPVFVDAATGLVATSAADEDERIAILYERGPLGVPPWSPPPKRTWLQALGRALGITGRPRRAPR